MDKKVQHTHFFDQEVQHTHLTLYIPSDLKKIAKASGLNLSQEFTEFMRIRLNQMPIETESIDYEKKAAMLKQELSICENKIKAQEEIKDKMDSIDSEKNLVIDHAIDNQLMYDKAQDIAEKRFVGIKYLWKQKFNENITDDEAKELIIQRLRKRGLIDG